MDALRWVLLLIGVGIFLIVYLVSKRKNAKEDSWVASPRSAGDADVELVNMAADPDEPMSLNELASNMRLHSDDDPVGGITSEAVQEDGQSVDSDEMLIVFYLLEKDNGALSGSQMIDALEAVGMRYGDMKIFHFYDPDLTNSKKAVFSIANIAEPGWFDLVSINQVSTPGMAMFLKLPCSMKSVKAFDKMLLVIEELMQLLPLTLKDNKHDKVSQQTLSHLREEVVEFERKRSIMHAAE